MQEDDFVVSVIDTVAEHVTLSKPKRAEIDQALRLNWGGMPVYVARRSPTMRQAIRDAVGTYDEIARAYGVSTTTVWRVRKGR
ncbi:MAG: hypothetical protein RL274_2870 [Pseudomonadota bacterium]